MPQQLLCGFHIRLRPAQPELIAARCDADAQSLLDLVQMTVEVTTQHRQVTGVIGFQGEGVLDQLSRGRLRGRFAIQGILSPLWAMQLLVRIYGNSQASTFEYLAAQRVGKRVQYSHVNKLSNQCVVSGGEVYCPVVFGTTL
jgi:hypothetical protein